MEDASREGLGRKKKKTSISFDTICPQSISTQNMYSIKPNLEELLLLALMLPQAKPSPKSLHQFTPPSFLMPWTSIISTISLPPTINKVMNQFASSQTIQQYSLHLLFLHLTITQQHIQIILVVPHQIPKRSLSLTTAPYTNHPPRSARPKHLNFFFKNRNLKKDSNFIKTKQNAKWYKQNQPRNPTY